VIGMVLAAGAGRRLRPDTDELPKTLLPVDGPTTILDIALRNLAAVGLRDVVLVVGHGAAVISERAADLESAHGVTLTLVHNDRAQEWNNAYSLWLAREYFAQGVLLLNGDTVHPVSVEKTLLAAQAERGSADVILAVDNVKQLGDEEMKVVLDDRGRLARITKAGALEATWRRDPGLYYEDGYQEFTDRGDPVAVAPIGALDWVEVDNHDDLRRARDIAAHC
jgi:choline kinase